MGKSKRKNSFNSSSTSPDKMASVPTPDTSSFPPALQANISLLSSADLSLISTLLSLDQEHLFSSWPPLGIDDSSKQNLMAQLHSLDVSCGSGGLPDYISRARRLLTESKNGVNPFDGWLPEVPTGEELQPFTHRYAFFEQLGQALLGRCAFVLVAGGLGERLGYREGVKLALPCETLSSVPLMSEFQLLLREEIIQNKLMQDALNASDASNQGRSFVEERPRRSFAELYSTQILAMQERYATRAYDSLYGRLISEDRSSPDYKERLLSVLREAQEGLVGVPGESPQRKLPLAIMVSDDTEKKTRELFSSRDFFGLQESQVTFLKQGKVPALSNASAHLALSSPFEVETKPHGHGDVHALLHASGLLPQWERQGIEYVIFLQDTNALSLLPLPAMLGVSFYRSLDVNSLAVRRVAKQSVGALIRLHHPGLQQRMTINVEYNVLDPLLRATGNPDGDVNDPKTGFSIYPGNINQLLFRLSPYRRTLEKTQGRMPEFVNPKYKDSQRETFKKPTRLECMMQDYPRLLAGSGSTTGPGGEIEGQVGFTVCPSWLCYSPLKNSLQAASESANTPGGPPLANALSAESDVLMVHTRLLNMMIRRGINFSNYCDLLDENSALCQRLAREEETEKTGEEENRLSASNNNSIPENTSSNVTIRLSVIAGIETITSPRVVFYPSFLIFPHEMIRRIPQPSKIFLSNRSSLTVKGDVILSSLQLDGSLIVVGDGCELDDYSLPSLASLATDRDCASSSNLLNSLRLNSGLEELKDSADASGALSAEASSCPASTHLTLIVDTNNKKSSCNNLLSNGGDQLLLLQEDLPYNPYKVYSSAITPVDAMRGCVLVRHENCALISPNYLEYVRNKKLQLKNSNGNVEQKVKFFETGQSGSAIPNNIQYKTLVFNGYSYIETSSSETLFKTSNEDQVAVTESLSDGRAMSTALTESVKLNRCIPCFGFH